MDLTAGQRKAVFGLIVVVLAGLGVYMFVPGARGGGGRPPAPSPSPRPTRAAATLAPSVPAASPSPASGAGPAAPDIYQWLPFTPAQLGSAAVVVTQFSAAYGTWSYSQNAAAYVATMRNLVTPELGQVLEQGYAAPGVAAQRASKKQVSAGSAVINALRAFGPSSITFVVTISQEITSTAGRSPASTQYAVTVAEAGASWQVNDIELASAGNS